MLTLDRDARKMSLGIKQLSEDPWNKEDVLTKYAIGTVHKGIIRNLTNFGLFLELEEGIDGLVHVSDLSWTKKVKHPSEFVKVGEDLEVKVLELDVDSRRLALGHKQMEENPWDTFQDLFPIGSVHKGTITSKTDKGATIELPYGIEGFANNKQLLKEDDTNPEQGEALDFRVVEFSKDDRRIVLSHLATYKEEEAKQLKKKAAARATSSGSNSGGGRTRSSGNDERSTLGDLSALSSLKEQMQENQKKAGAATKEEAKEASTDKTAASESVADAKSDEETIEEAPDKSAKKVAEKENATPASETKSEATADATKEDTAPVDTAPVDTAEANAESTDAKADDEATSKDEEKA